MPEYAGPLQSVELATFLWLAPLIPIAAAIYVVISGLPLARGITASGPVTNPRNVAGGASALALGVVAVHGAELGSDSTRALLSHAWGILRVGSLDAGFTLVLEPSSAILALVVSFVAVAALASLPREARDQRSTIAGILLLHSGMLLVLLGNDWVLLLCGSNLVGVGAYSVLLERDDAGAKRVFVVGRVADALMLAAAVVLLWGLGGSWTGRGDYVPDFRPRIVSVVRGDPKLLVEKEKEVAPRARTEGDGQASLSSAALPGSALSLGGAELCETDRDGKSGGLGSAGRACTTRARTPFSHNRVSAALHDIRFHTGPGSNDLMVDKVRLVAGRDTLLVVAGATLSLRDAREQLLLRDSTGAYPMRAALAKRKFLGMPFWGVVGALLGCAALVRILLAGVRFAQSSNSRATAVLFSTELLVGAAVVSRVDFAFALVPGVAAVTALVATAGAVWLAACAAHARDVREAGIGVVGSGFALAIAGLALGAHSQSVALLAVTVLGGAALLIALGAVGAETLASSTGLGARMPAIAIVARLAALGLTGAPVPLSFARGGVAEDIARAEAFGMPVGWVLAGLFLIATGVAAFAVWRVVFVVFDSEPEKKKKPVMDRRSRSAVLVLSMCAVGVGLLALPAGVFGEGIPAPLDHWLTIGPIEEMATPGAPLDKSVRLGLVVLVAVAGIVGFVLARTRYRMKRPAEWKESESTRFGHAFLASDARSLGSALALPFTALAAVAAKLDALFEKTALGMPPNDVEEDDA